MDHRGGIQRGVAVLTCAAAVGCSRNRVQVEIEDPEEEAPPAFARAAPDPDLALAPNFALLDQHEKAVSLEGLTARGPVMVLFYLGGWCPYCRRQLYKLVAAAVSRH